MNEAQPPDLLRGKVAGREGGEVGGGGVKHDPPTFTETTGEQRGGERPDARISHVQHLFTFVLAEVGGRSQFVMLKYERTGPGRVKAHGRGLSVYFWL